MDRFTFIVRLVEAISWPLTVVILVLCLRVQLVALLPFVKRVKAGPLEAEFEKEVRELRSSADSTAGLVATEKPVWQEDVEKIAKINPRTAIMESWRQTESALIKSLRAISKELAEQDVRSTRDVLRLLGERGVASIEEISMLNQLRFLRNQAAHVDSFNPTFDAAMNFVRLSGELIGRISNRA